MLASGYVYKELRKEEVRKELRKEVLSVEDVLSAEGARHVHTHTCTHARIRTLFFPGMQHQSWGRGEITTRLVTGKAQKDLLS